MDDVTRLGDAAVTTSSGADWGRFAAGTLFAGRFRIVSPLGKGGMGEVYRAEDLTLGQTVALKFLPDSVVRDPVRLAQFHNEVRVARTISHRNICRVYDIGDADGRAFLTMEYVDGEDLASLLRRIGRFPQERAIDVARQICAGVSAAHERGVLHRDLKPANIMIDGDGHVRITDFGLASAGSVVDNIRAGTPAYMAPEQLAGREVSARSDIYALGLVLFEVFTGRRAFDATSLHELMRLHESGAVATPSSVVRDLDPTIERAILRCLERDPDRRPASALAVAAGLPGRNQLDAALAAGETPSPEMVAAAGEQSALRAEIGLAILAIAVVALVGVALVGDRVLLLHRIPITKSTDGLRDRADELLQRFGYTDRAADSADGWFMSSAFLSYVARTDRRRDRWNVLASGRAPTVAFWHRTSDRELVPIGRETSVTLDDPPPTVPGMRTVILDPGGRLVALRVVPPLVRGAPSPVAFDWTSLFDAAGLPRASFRRVTPQVTPPAFADAQAAFEGTMPGIEQPVRIEAAALDGRPTYFSILGPWNDPATSGPRAGGSPTSLFAAGSAAVFMLLLAGGSVLARINLRSGRSDRRGAFRMASVVFVAWVAYLMIGGRHSASITTEYVRITGAIGIALFGAAGLWLTYVALEPYARRFWPRLLIGWSRLVSGRYRDPVVGREILFGVAAGALIALYIFSHALVQIAMGLAPLPAWSGGSVAALLGTRAVASVLLSGVPRAVISPFQVLFVVVLLKALVRRTWLVLALTCVIIFPVAINGLFSGEQLALDVPYTVVGILLVTGVLLRFGLVALCVTFYVFESLNALPVTGDFSTAYATASTWLLFGVAALGAYGFYASRGDEPLVGRLHI
jgi:predicted Ser/Thr protein kinase